MNNFDTLQRQLNQLKNALGFLDSRQSEKQLEQDFMRYAQSDDEDLSGETPPQNKPEQMTDGDISSIENEMNEVPPEE